MSTFRTITLADWPHAIRRARAERNAISDRIAAKVLQRGGARSGIAAQSDVTSRPAASAISDNELLSRVLDVSEFYRWRQECDGSRTAFFQLRKPIPGFDAGSVLSLARLHEVLRG